MIDEAHCSAAGGVVVDWLIVDVWQASCVSAGHLENLVGDAEGTGTDVVSPLWLVGVPRDQFFLLFSCAAFATDSQQAGES